ncbi:hypothetical protein SEPCBS119000_004980 [Sporothrix epigloea]|uniref:Voltage-gated hydrogen channel 1 n=1 Tax=Sporothrix epigloea TaxID=1892477 RepID=A0ABP0DV16_9PEZI
MADNHASQPLLHQPVSSTTVSQYWSRLRRQSQRFLASTQKHYLILALVGIDVVAILAEILISLVACETGTKDRPWVDPALETFKIIGLVISSLFLVELLASLWAFGWELFSSWFHCFDAFVILVGFIIDVLAHGVLEDIASLVVVLRLWRVVKIVEEMSVGAEERMEELEAQVEKLERENTKLNQQLRALESGEL